PYPALISDDAARRDRTLAAWATLTSEQGAARAPAPELQPVTATLRALPAITATAAPLLRLPQVGGAEGRAPTEEETRESLRRFIAGAGPLLGASPEELSLVEIKDGAGGTKRARYRQNPFSYPLRGGYGEVNIVFTPDRRVVELSSTAVPDAGRVARALAAVRPQLTAERLTAALNGRAVTYTDGGTDAGGGQQTVTLAASEQTTVQELVIYLLRGVDSSGAAVAGAPLAFHLAWEVRTTQGGTPLLIYVDAVTGDTLAATVATAAAAPDAGQGGAVIMSFRLDLTRPTAAS
ncbi:MAG: hypothetical protein ACRD68_18080, partial [Pyrinomonadaceae bacterium]